MSTWECNYWRTISEREPATGETIWYWSPHWTCRFGRVPAPKCDSYFNGMFVNQEDQVWWIGADTPEPPRGESQIAFERWCREQHLENENYVSTANAAWRAGVNWLTKLKEPIKSNER